MAKRGQEAAFEIVRSCRPEMEALAAAPVRLERVTGATVGRYIKVASKGLVP